MVERQIAAAEMMQAMGVGAGRMPAGPAAPAGAAAPPG
jgi:hypothetical protein